MTIFPVFGRRGEWPYSVFLQLAADDSPVLADFGMARLHTASMTAKKTGGAFGTMHWMAPEMITDSEVSPGIDVYAFGIILWEMCSGQIPWVGLLPPAVMYKVTQGQRPFVDRSRWPSWTCDVMERCWAHDRKLRPSMTEVLVELKKTRMRR
jgi:serine/threonine protein kinase